MWQSHVEIKGYSVAYFNCIAVFEAPYRWTSVKGGAHMCFADAWISNKSTERIWSLPLTEVQHPYSGHIWEISAAQRFERSDVTEIHDGIIFDFHTGLPYMDVYGFDDISEMPQ